MIKNKRFQEKMKKYKKINIFPKNNHFKTKENISPLNPKPNIRLKCNLNQLLLENSDYSINYSQKNKSYMNYINSKTSLHPYFNAITEKNNENNYNYLPRNKSSNNIFNKKYYFPNRHQKVLDELNIMKKNNDINNIHTNIINNINYNINNNIDNNMNINYQLKNYKSKSINITSISSKKNLYDKIISRNIKTNNENNTFNNNENNELNKKIDTLNSTLLYEQRISKRKNKIKYDIEKKKMKEIINLERAKKIKGISAGRISFKNTSKKGEIIKSKLNKIKVFARKKIQSTPKKNVILRTCESRIKNKYRIFIDQNYFGNYSTNNTEYYYKNNNTINTIDLSRTYNYKNYSCDCANNKHTNKKIKNNVDLILKDKYLKTNIEPNLNFKLNTINLYNNEEENKIHNWIIKEKRNKEIKERLNDELFFEEKKNNKDFQKYKLSNKYFNNDILFNDRRPFKSINLGKYFDLELSRFNNKLNNFNHVKKAKNIINSKHIFKPIY